jgi:hypothetical protein
MTISDYVLITSAIIVVLGWFVNSYLNRSLEISKKRMERRLDALLSFLPAFLSLTSSNRTFRDDPAINEKMKQSWVNFQLYGYQDEIDLHQEFNIAINNKDSIEEVRRGLMENLPWSVPAICIRSSMATARTIII